MYPTEKKLDYWPNKPRIHYWVDGNKAIVSTIGTKYAVPSDCLIIGAKTRVTT